MSNEVLDTQMDDDTVLVDRLADRLDAGDRFASLMGTDTDEGLRLTALLATPDTIEPFDWVLPPGTTSYPSLTPRIPAAFWYERDLHDLFGVTAAGHPRLDPLTLPLSDDSERPVPGRPGAPWSIQPDEHILPRLVVGTGLFTIPHGPVRSGVSESVEFLVETPGEDIPELRVRVYAKHRGIEKRFEGMDAATGVLLAERVEGIASVAHALAFAHAVEALGGVRPPRPARLIRTLHAELERIANHLDVAMRLADAAGLAVATARFGAHKERVLRLVGRLCGSRFGRGVVVPGGVRALPALRPDRIRAEMSALASGIMPDAELLMNTSSFIDRLRHTGVLDTDLAIDHGALGPVGRASGLADDDRIRRPYDAYDELVWRPATPWVSCDARARLQIRFDEIDDACTLIDQIVTELSTMDPATPLCRSVGFADGRGIGWAEAPQGEVLYVLEVSDGRIRRCRPRSASFHNLAVFSHTFNGDVLTDFAFIEASFGLSMAGVAL